VLSKVALATKARAKRNAPERKRIAAYRDTVDTIEREFGNGPTAGTLVRLRADPLKRIKDKLNVWEFTAASTIRFAFSASIGATATHDPSLGIRHEFRPGGADAAAAKRIDSIVAYRQWRIDLAGTPALAVAMGVLVDDMSPSAIDRNNSQRKGTAFGYLIVALRHFAALTGNTPRGARDWRLKTANPLTGNK
jgi:hypothetical protein